MQLTSKELLEIIASDIKEINLEHYTAIYAIGDLANRLINVTHVGADIEKVLYRYSNWYDTATRVVLDDTALYEYARNIIEWDSANYDE